jgi:hypothetical protein
VVRALRVSLLAAAVVLTAQVPIAQADMVKPASARDFRDSIGVTTHIVYYDTTYGDWPRIVQKLEELGVRHLRDGVAANPAWRDWNARYYEAVALAAAHGMRFNFGMGEPGNPRGTLDQVIDVVAGRLRYAADALEGPNEFDHFVGGKTWPIRLRTYGRELYRKVKRNPSLRSLPLLAPSFATFDGPQRYGKQSNFVDVGNVHPYTGGLSPRPEFVRAAVERARITAGHKPVWATEAGFHNALRATRDQPPISEAGAAVYLLRTFLEHFKGGINRTYVYELIDEKPDPRLTDPEQHFGLLRQDFSPKPAFKALRNLLTLVGRSDERVRPRPLRLTVSSRHHGVRQLVLRKADGTYLVALWRLDSVWDIERRRPLGVAPRRVRIALPGAARVARADPIASPALKRLRLRRGGQVGIRLGARPIVLHVTPKG